MTDRFQGVDVITRARLSLGGQRVERTVILPDGEMKSLGLMHPGTYRLQNEEAERLQILAGVARYRLAGEAEWRELREGDTVYLPAQTEYELEVLEHLDFIASLGGSRLPS